MHCIALHCSAANIFHCDLDHEHVTHSGKLEIISGISLEQFIADLKFKVGI